MTLRIGLDFAGSKFDELSVKDRNLNNNLPSANECYLKDVALA
jgi:hypothetical protein